MHNRWSGAVVGFLAGTLLSPTCNRILHGLIILSS